MTFIDRVQRTLERYVPNTQNYIPFRISFSLQTPMFIGDNWYHIDALIAKSLMQELLGDTFFDLPAKQSLPVSEWLRLPIRYNRGGIYHASVLMPRHSTKKMTRIYKRFDESDPFLNTKARIRRGTGYFRDYMIQMPYLVTDTVSAYVCGDMDEIRRLLSSIVGVGKKTAIGGGTILSTSFAEVERDCSLVCDGHAMREIPVEMCSHYDKRQVMRRATIFPYWDVRNVRLAAIPGSPVALKDQYTEGI